MNLIQRSFQELFPTKEFQYQTILKYNKKLGDFNANIRLQSNLLQINMNHKWKTIDHEIQMGLIQHLLLKLFAKRYKTKIKPTFNIELYNAFIKKIPQMTKITHVEPTLLLSFMRVNEQFFHNLLDQPNLKWGQDSKTKLAHYNFHNDTVVLSSIFQQASEPIIDYLMYHELLHKKQQFYTKNNRSYFHTTKFKQAEDLYPNRKQIEREINQIIKNSKRKQTLFSKLFS